MKHLKLLLLLLMMYFPSQATAYIMTITDVSDDTIVSRNSSYMNTNYGSSTNVNFFEDTSHGLQAVYIRFNITQSQIDELSGKYIDSAKIRFWRYGGTATSWEYLDIHQVPTSWSESTITWNNQPIITSVGDSGYTDSYLYETQYVGDDVLLSWIEIDITGILENWVQGTQNYGVKLETNSVHYNTDLRFNLRSSEYSSDTPELVITYLDSAPVNPVPEPLSIVLFLSALARLAFFLKKIN